MKKTTLQQVALEAGVSLATASVILNQKPGYSFSADTVGRVWSASERLGYRFRAAEDVSLLDRKTIVIFSASISGYYHAAIVQAVEQAAHAAGYHTVCYQSYHDAQRETWGIRMAQSARVSGMIFTYLPIHFSELEGSGIPTVAISEHNNQLHLDCIETNNFYASTLMARHLLQLGHRKVAFLNERFEWEGFPSSTRLTGFADTFRRECPQAELVVFNSRTEMELDGADFDYLSRERAGCALAQRCLSERPDVTALVAVCDIFAFGILHYMRENGLRVPQDYSVCGYDNNYASAMMNLTTYEHRVRELGTLAFELLTRQIHRAKTDSGAIRKLEVIGQLIARGSTGAPRMHD